MPRKVIIGIVGGSPPDDPDTTVPLATELGKAVAYQQQILLTGGTTLSEGSKNVKDAAMLGAAAAEANARGHVIARLIGILKGGRPMDGFPGSRFRLFLSTGLGDERNVITGITPDILIALNGGAGTLSEISFALEAKKTVLFVQCVDNLLDKLEQEQEINKFRKILEGSLLKFNLIADDPAQIREVITQRIASLTSALTEAKESNPNSVVAEAIERFARHELGSCDFPGLPTDSPRDPNNSRSQFKKWLARMDG